MIEQELPWVVGDGWPDGNRHPEPGTHLPTLGRFATEEEGAAFIETLPDYLEGRYSLDGPGDDDPDIEQPMNQCDVFVLRSTGIADDVINDLYEAINSNLSSAGIDDWDLTHATNV